MKKEIPRKKPLNFTELRDQLGTNRSTIVRNYDELAPTNPEKPSAKLLVKERGSVLIEIFQDKMLFWEWSKKQVKWILISSFSGGEGQSNEIIQTTYAELKDLVDNEQLVPNATYMFEYLCEYYMPFTDNVLNTTDTENPVLPETFLVTALDNKTLNQEVKSLEYPSDTIYYDIDNSRYLDSEAPTSRGFVYRRVRGGGNIDYPCDWRGCRFTWWYSTTNDDVINNLPQNDVLPMIYKPTGYILGKRSGVLFSTFTCENLPDESHVIKPLFNLTNQTINLIKVRFKPWWYETSHPFTISYFDNEVNVNVRILYGVWSDVVIKCTSELNAFINCNFRTPLISGNRGYSEVNVNGWKIENVYSNIGIETNHRDLINSSFINNNAGYTGALTGVNLTGLIHRFLFVIMFNHGTNNNRNIITRSPDSAEIKLGGSRYNPSFIDIYEARQLLSDYVESSQSWSCNDVVGCPLETDRSISGNTLSNIGVGYQGIYGVFNITNTGMVNRLLSTNSSNFIPVILKPTAGNTLTITQNDSVDWGILTNGKTYFADGDNGEYIRLRVDRTLKRYIVIEGNTI